MIKQHFKYSGLYVLLTIICLAFSPTVQSQSIVPYSTPPSWSPDGSMLAIVNNDNFTVEVYDLERNMLMFTLFGHSNWIPVVVWSADGRLLAIPSNDKTTTVWDMTNGSLLYNLVGHEDEITFAVFSPDGTQLITSGVESNPSLFFWDMQTGALVSQQDAGSIADAAFSPDGQYLATVTGGLDVRDVRQFDKFELVARYRQPLCCENLMYSLAWSPDGTHIVTGSTDGQITIWDASNLEIVRQFLAGPSSHPEEPFEIRTGGEVMRSWVRDVQYDPTGERILSVAGDGTVSEWDANTGELIQQTEIGQVFGATWSRYGGQLAVTDVSSTIATDMSSAETNRTSNGLRVVVPFATMEKLESLIEACNQTVSTDQRLTTTIQVDQLTDFVAQVESLPENSIAPACVADLLAVAEALQTEN